MGMSKRRKHEMTVRFTTREHAELQALREATGATGATVIRAAIKLLARNLQVGEQTQDKNDGN